MLIKSSLVIVLVVLSLYTEVSSQGWNGIIPCKTTRFAVEEFLGEDNFPTPDAMGSYKFNNLSISVYYERTDKVNPQKNIVQRLNVYPEEPELLEDYIRNLPDFSAEFLKTELDEKITHVRGRAVYRCRKKGLELWVQKDEEDREVIVTFGYFDPDYSCSTRSP